LKIDRNIQNRSHVFHKLTVIKPTGLTIIGQSNFWGHV